MAVDVSTIDEYTDAEILKVLRSALISAAIAQSYSIGGRQLNRMSGRQIQSLIEIYERRVASSADDNAGIALVRFGTPQ